MTFTVKKVILDKKRDSRYILKSQYKTLELKKHIGELILKEFQNAPNFVGQIHATTELTTTFREMRERSVKCALWLRKAGINSDKKMVICTSNVIEAYVPFLAGLYNSTTVHVWDTKYCYDNIRLLFFLTQTYPDIIFIDCSSVAYLYSAILILKQYEPYMRLSFPKIVVIGSAKMEFVSLESIINIDDFDENEIDKFKCIKLKSTMDTAVQMFSSNAVSYPGNARIPYAAFISPSNNNTPAMSRNEVGLWFGSLCWTHSLLLTVRCILSHVTAIKFSVFCEGVMYRIIEKYKVNWMFLESTMYFGFSDLRRATRRYNFSSLKQILFGDTVIPDPIRKDISESLETVAITQVYCTSETGVIAYQRCDSKIGSCGYVSNNVQVMIIDEKTRKLAGPNFKGEIWCKTPCIAADSVTKCNSDVFDGWFYTGDFGYYDENGNIFVLDKVNNIIRYREQTFYPSKIEDMIKLYFNTLQTKDCARNFTRDFDSMQSVNISDIAIVTQPCEHLDHYPLVYVKRSLGSKVTRQKLKELLSNIVPYFPAVRIIFLKHDMPYLPNGKIDRARLHSQPIELTE